jgi:hypothetical protein
VINSTPYINEAIYAQEIVMLTALVKKFLNLDGEVKTYCIDFEDEGERQCLLFELEVI